MHGCLAFESFRTAQPGSSIYRNGMSHWSLERPRQRRTQRHAAAGELGAAARRSSPSIRAARAARAGAANSPQQVLDALTANPDVWSQDGVLPDLR